MYARNLVAGFSIWLSIFFLSGCAASYNGYPDGDPATLINEDSTRLTDAAITAFDTNPSAGERNRILLARKAFVDGKFVEFEKALHKETVTSNVGVDWLLLAISGATATIGGEAVKAALGAASTGIQGARSSFDKRAFREKSLAAILAKMKAARAERALAMHKGMGNSLTAYPLEAGLADLSLYYEAGTLPAALAGLVESANVDKRKAEDDLRILLDDEYGFDELSKLIEQYLYPDGVAQPRDAAHAANVTACMTQVGLPTGPGMIAGLLTGNTSKAGRLAVAECLSLNQ